MRILILAESVFVPEPPVSRKPFVSLLSNVGVGIVVFATTNIDDILLLAAFFADRTLPSRAIVVGQFTGIGALTAVSAMAALLALAIPDGWIGLLGLAPLFLG